MSGHRHRELRSCWTHAGIFGDRSSSWPCRFGVPTTRAAPRNLPAKGSRTRQARDDSHTGSCSPWQHQDGAGGQQRLGRVPGPLCPRQADREPAAGGGSSHKPQRWGQHWPCAPHGRWQGDPEGVPLPNPARHHMARGRDLLPSVPRATQRLYKPRLHTQHLYSASPGSTTHPKPEHAARPGTAGIAAATPWHEGSSQGSGTRRSPHAVGHSSVHWRSTGTSARRAVVPAPRGRCPRGEEPAVGHGTATQSPARPHVGAKRCPHTAGAIKGLKSQ